MNKYWKSRFEYWTTVQAITPERQRRGHLLSLFLLIFIAIGVVLVLQNAWGWLVNGNIVAGRFALVSLLGVGIFAGLGQLNRRGHTSLIAHFLLNLVIIATSALSEMAFLSAVFIAFAIPIIMAGFVLPPKWSFPYAALTALGYILRYQFEDVSIPLYSDKQIAVLFGLAAVTYLIASRYQDALKRAHQELENRERAEDALKASEKRFRALIEHGADQIALLAPDGTLLYENPTVARPLGYPLGAFLGRNLFELVHPDDVARARQTWETVLDQPSLSLQAAFRLRHADDSWSWMEGTAINLLSEPAVQAVVINYRDVTERKQAESEREKLITELTAKNVEMERFTYVISHDLKSPLYTIRAFLGYVEQDALAGNAQRLKVDIQRISDATDKMKRLLNELLELSRIGRLKYEPQLIPFAELAREAAELVHGQIIERRIAVYINEDLSTVFGDRQRLLEVLQNLIDNAAKFMGDQKEPRIEIGQAGEDTDREMLVFYVKDNGMGIQPEYHERIFGLFNKLNPLDDGTGIGLAIVKRIIEFHGGRIWVESTLGQGATFLFTLPAKGESR